MNHNVTPEEKTGAGATALRKSILCPRPKIPPLWWLHLSPRRLHLLESFQNIRPESLVRLKLVINQAPSA